MIGGQPATVGFSGLAPGIVGEYQVNVTVPPGLSAGNQQYAKAAEYGKQVADSGAATACVRFPG